MKTRNANDGYSVSWGTLQSDWPLWAWMLGLFIVGLALYPVLPERVPSHWNWQGQVDGYSSRGFGAFFMPLLIVGIYAMMVFAPLLDPKRVNYARFAGAYRFLRWAIVLFMGSIYLVTLLVALGYRIDVGMVVKALVAILFAIIGNFMGQLRHNYFVGIRTPWTLANEEVWRRTHRMAGRLWVLAGIAELALAPVQSAWSGYMFLALVVAMVLTPVVYSYLIYRQVS